jgi:gliding motility-associated-like protein
MRNLILILSIIPLWLSAQDIQRIKVCTDDQSYLQEYWVSDGPNTYNWVVEGGYIESGQGTNQIEVNWLNIPYEMYMISVSVTGNTGCPGDSSMIFVDIDECSFNGIYIPNAFTPNGQQPNDIFNAIGEDIEELDMYIFNRWGQEIFESHNGEGWDGKMNNIDCQIDVYVWLIYYRFEGETFTHQSIGHVSLIR